MPKKFGAITNVVNGAKKMSDPNKNNSIFKFRIELFAALIAIIIGIIVVTCVYEKEEQVEDTTMIEGKCHTYLDEFKKCTWPTNFCIAPQIGQRVEALESIDCSLRIQQITHCERPNRIGIENEPYLKIELR